MCFEQHALTSAAAGLGAFVEPGDVAVAEFTAADGLGGWGGRLVNVGVAGHPTDDEAVEVQDGAAARVGFGVLLATIWIIWMDPADVLATAILESDDVENFWGRTGLVDPI